MRGHEPLVDAAATAVLVACWTLFGVAVRGDGAYFLLTLGLLLPLAVRRRYPAPVAGVVLAVAFVQWLTVRDTIGALPADLAVPIVIHAAAAYGKPWASNGALGVGLAGAVLGGLSWPQLATSAEAHLLTGAFLTSVVVAAWAIGTLAGVRRRQAETLADRARLLERTRIAREMHDVVAHSLAVLIAQADGGRYATSPEARANALTTIADYGRQALAETRRVLGVLRDGPTTEPMPGLGDVPALVEQVRSGGLAVSLEIEAPPDVEPGLGLVAYRIVQEGLTNVLKHAGPCAEAEVSVRWGPRQLEIDVRDDGRGTPGTATSGYGLVGMRERANAYGGVVTLEPRPGGGRVLSARIPL
ncbi:Signal transduction histidine kinase [Amycolatopsis xylanica]|uniref:histidine kinase n=2 Tax=Amycolatopsis xylanica TaxID=589385 RepID=A0A1H3RHK8_9PSEU|nr:Signal transduction histidine kinase [Amycolatopsis xylanica]